MKHGNETFYIEGEGTINAPILPLEEINSIFENFEQNYNIPRPDPLGREEDEPITKPRRKFCRLFTRGSQQEASKLIELGLKMESENISSSNDIATNSNIPGGYTYLGQFIDHDITRDESQLTETGTQIVENLNNFRTPSLDLDCLYGSGPELSPELYEDKIRLKVGITSKTDSTDPGGEIKGGFANDLPRRDDKKALIGDGRNDENLAVAQTHLAFIKLHNKNVEQIKNKDGLKGEELFKKSREKTILQYQSIILNDFLPRIIQKEVLEEVKNNGRKFYTDELTGSMPVEFSVAAYRLGHSMIRPAYNWNKVFNKNGGIPATIELLFEFSQVSGSTSEMGDSPFFGKPTVPSNWIIDWSRFYDFSSIDGIDNHPDNNFTKKIDPNLAFGLQNLPEFAKQNLPSVFLSLATRNLLRGRLLSLPSGQNVAQEMNNKGVIIKTLTSEQISSGPHEAIIKKNGFDKDTPLWYYILKEAEIFGEGNHLGPVGSRILAEVFIGLVVNSEISILKNEDNLNYSMPKMLSEINDINPLGD